MKKRKDYTNKKAILIITFYLLSFLLIEATGLTLLLAIFEKIGA